jgi:protein tyrosine/serine phosphatase
MSGWWPSASAKSATLLINFIDSWKLLNLNSLTRLSPASSQFSTAGRYSLIDCPKWMREMW